VAKKVGGAESEYHIVAVRMRVVGEGDLDLTLASLDNVKTLNLVSLPMTPTTRIEPTRLANFQSQRTRLEGSTSEIDEWFLISRIIIFAKPVAVEYPG
jgi:hypothetical protein